MEKRILSILVDNTSGVLSRVAGLFSRRGYNIDSITAGVTADQRYSRMTVVCEGDDQMLQQLTKSISKGRFGGFGGPGGMPTLGKAKKGKLQGFGRKKRLK